MGEKKQSIWSALQPDNKLQCSSYITLNGITCTLNINYKSSLRSTKSKPECHVLPPADRDEVTDSRWLHLKEIEPKEHAALFLLTYNDCGAVAGSCKETAMGTESSDQHWFTNSWDIEWLSLTSLPSVLLSNYLSLNLPLVDSPVSKHPFHYICIPPFFCSLPVSQSRSLSCMLIYCLHSPYHSFISPPLPPLFLFFSFFFYLYWHFQSSDFRHRLYNSCSCTNLPSAGNKAWLKSVH